MNWIKTEESLPEQGRKVLCIIDNTPVTALRLKQLWLPFPFLDSQYGCFKQPNFWCYVELPNGLLGMHKVFIDGQMMSMDQFSRCYPEQFDSYVDRFIEKYEHLCANWEKSNQTFKNVHVADKKILNEITGKYYGK